MMSLLAYELHITVKLVRYSHTGFLCSRSHVEERVTCLKVKNLDSNRNPGWQVGCTSIMLYGL